MVRHDESKPVNLPGPQLVPGRDDDLIEWAQQATRDKVSKSAVLRDALRAYLRNDFDSARLVRIEGMVEKLLQGGVKVAPPKEEETTIERFNNPFLDSEL